MKRNSATENDEDATTRRVFLEVQIHGEEPHRFLQLEPHVNFKNVLKSIRRAGDLVWNGLLLRPMETPKSVGMPRGLANVVFLRLFTRGHAATDAAGSEEARAPERSREVIGALAIGLRELRLELEEERGKRETLEREFCRLQWERRRPRHRSTAEEIHRWQMEELRRQRGVTWRTQSLSVVNSN
ncbi:hypothetical protein C3747_55g66 [Trypanosoma cruzi]|uniref:Uncharacterized protein n=1 Tax=Trypanosoma cruzi TaxID=5693 RepID=A0A2V2WUN5_TRYCR|nr:hypothetical protein TcYC6_0052840 [Trypanosoma cruzi]PWV11932.1 hypothetical protein C3747_55g66 [Trypanosoma cruzi]